MADMLEEIHDAAAAHEIAETQEDVAVAQAVADSAQQTAVIASEVAVNVAAETAAVRDDIAEIRAEEQTEAVWRSEVTGLLGQIASGIAALSARLETTQQTVTAAAESVEEATESTDTSETAELVVEAPPPTEETPATRRRGLMRRIH